MDQTQSTTSTGFEINSGAPVPLLNRSLGATSGLAGIAHEARNMVAALGLYCDLLEEPGVFSEPFRHYGSELKMVASASRSLVNRLLTLSSGEGSSTTPQLDTSAAHANISLPEAVSRQAKSTRYWDELPPCPINDLAWELLASRSLLAALAGQSIALTLDTVGGALPVRLNSEDLTRILVNLVKNSVEAIRGSGGRIHLVLQECQTGPGEETLLLLNIEDNGVGISPDALEQVFEAGYTKHSKAGSAPVTPQAAHRGLGLSITRSIVESAGGCIRAANRDPVGACIQIELPVRAV